ncbi:MAG: winged helix-turn-helix domain-containing protein [Thaumarchaeota archaeon]|nr:winged helix-turn-helix domain-containing protein [Nitrososphaerota archaeon]
MTRVPFPESFISLTKSDWNIISKLEMNVDKSLKEVSEELQISSRTVKRRMARLVKNNIIFTLASANVGAIREAVMADLVVEYDTPALRPRVDKMLLDLLEPYYYSTGPWESYGLFALILPNISKSREILETVRRMSGIKSVRLELVEERYEYYDYLYEAVDRKLATLPVD